MRRPVVSLGDLLRALGDLGPGDEEAFLAIHDMLGLEVDRATDATPSAGAFKASSTHSVESTQRRGPRVLDLEHPRRAPSRRPDASGGAPIGTALTLVQGRTRSFTPRLPRPAGPLPAPLGTAEPGPVSRDIDPLFARVARRGILSAAIATSVPEGDLDLDGLVSVLASGRPVRRLLRLPVPTLRSGAQVLIDTSPTLDPYRLDVAPLIRSLDDILADDRLEVLRFWGVPDRVGTGRRRSWTDWTPPAPGVPVVVVSDLGINRHAVDEDVGSEADWLRFARRVRGTGHPLLAFVPFEANRWPPLLSREMTILHWSERTRVGAIRRAVREGGRRVR